MSTFTESQKQADSTTRQATVSFGPEMPGIGSWEWLGADLIGELGRYYQTSSWDRAPQESDVVFIIKEAPPLEFVRPVSARSTVVYCPVDFYGSIAQIDRDGSMLRLCDRVMVHSDRLRRYFEPYASVVLMDHPVKYATEGSGFKENGFVLWLGMQTQLPILAGWLDYHRLPAELRILTNLPAHDGGGVFGHPGLVGSKARMEACICPVNRDFYFGSIFKA